MGSNELTDVLEMNGEERYDYFLSAVLEERDVWILINTDNRFLKTCFGRGRRGARAGVAKRRVCRSVCQGI